MKFAAAAFAAVLLIAAPALADEFEDRLDMLYGDHESFGDAYDAFVGAVEAGDVDTVASMVSYPFTTSIDGEQYVIADETAFAEWYDYVITDNVSDIVLNQPYDELFANAEGIMWGDGAVWMSPVCLDDGCAEFYWLVTGVNQPE